MRAAFRKLATLTLFAWGFFYGPGASATFVSPDFYYKSEYGDFTGSSPSEVCSNYFSDNNGRVYTSYKVEYVGGTKKAYQCTADYRMPSGSTGTHGAMIFTIGNCAAPYTLDSATGMCTSCPTMVGEEASLNWPLGRYMSESESSFEEFRSPPPSSGCFNNCTATRSGFTGEPVMPSDGPFPRIVKASIPYAYTGQACYASSTEPVPPDFPASGGDSGGDTGGGDDGSGTGDGGSGGGTDGGSGGSSGGGSGGGGDTGGGDTGGDTGGGDTGGDTGGDAGGDTGAQDDLATSGDIRSLGDRVTGAISEAYDRLASAISGVRNDLQGMSEAIEELSGPEWGADGGLDDGSGIGELGGELGGVIAEGLNTAADDAIASRDGELQDALDGIAGQVEDWFGDKGSKIDPDNLLGFLPREASCSDIPINVKFGREDASLVIPVCSLSPVKEILKWVFYALTIIGIWKILMNGMIVSARGGKGR